MLPQLDMRKMGFYFNNLLSSKGAEQAISDLQAALERNTYWLLEGDFNMPTVKQR